MADEAGEMRDDAGAIEADGVAELTLEEQKLADEAMELQAKLAELGAQKVTAVAEEDFEAAYRFKLQIQSLERKSKPKDIIDAGGCRGHGRPELLEEIAMDLQSSLLESISDKIKDGLVGDRKGGMCTKASAHLDDLGSVTNCSSHLGYYSTAQIVANLLHLVVQLTAFPKPVCVTDHEVQAKKWMKNSEVQCQMSMHDPDKCRDVEIQTEPVGVSVEMQTQPSGEGVETQTEEVLVECHAAETQTEGVSVANAAVQVLPSTADVTMQAMPETCASEQQTAGDYKCQCCREKPYSVSHCADCIDFLRAPQTDQLMWKRLAVPDSAHAETQAGTSTCEAGMQAVVSRHEESVQVRIAEWCGQCKNHQVEQYRCEECIDSLVGPKTMGAKRTTTLGSKRGTTMDGRKRATTMGEKLIPVMEVPPRASSTDTCEMGVQVQVVMETIGMQAVTTMQNAALQAVAATREVEVEASIDAICLHCNVNPMTQCATCSGMHMPAWTGPARMSVPTPTLVDENILRVDTEQSGPLGGTVAVFEAFGKLEDRLCGKGVEKTSSVNTHGERTNSAEVGAEKKTRRLDFVKPDAGGSVIEYEPSCNESSAISRNDTNIAFICHECHVQEAFVQGGRCGDCVSYPLEELGPDRTGSRGVRIGGGFDVLQVTGDRGRMAAAREAIQETVRAASPHRMAQDGSPWLYVHGAPSSNSPPDRFLVGMLARPGAQGGRASPDARTPQLTARKRTPAVSAEGLMQASLSALNRDGPGKTMGGEPYLYRVMAPSARRPDVGGHRPTTQGNAFM